MTLRGTTTKQNDAAAGSSGDASSINSQNAPMAGRHESASSTRSTDTVRGPGYRGLPGKLNTAKKQYVTRSIYAAG